MRRTVCRVTVASAGMVLAAATSALAQLPLRVDDVPHTIENSLGYWTLSVAVRLTGPPPAEVRADWTLEPGSAKAADSDYQMASGTLVFPALVDAPQNIDIQVNGDAMNEWSVTEQRDEVFYIKLSNATGPAFIDKGRTTITLIDDDRSNPGVQFLAATSGGNLTPATVKLQWRNPGAQVQPTDLTIRWNNGGGCSSPTTVGGGVGGINLGPPGLAGTVQVFTQSSTPGLPHCYSVFTVYGGTPTLEVAQIKAAPFDGAGTVAWRYFTLATNVVPPTIGADAIYTVDNQGVVHAIERGPSGGDWPTVPFAWNPLSVGRPTQNRSPVIPFVNGWRLFLGTDGGGVHAIDARNGRVLWSRSSTFTPGPLPSLGFVQAQPAALLKNFGGNNDMLLVGTNTGNPNNSFFALDPATGVDLASYPDALMGDVKGMAVVDYAANRVYFLTASSSATLFALDLGPPLSPSLTLTPGLPGGNRRSFGGSSGSAVLRNNRLIFGNNSGEVRAVNLADGLSHVPYATGDGQVKGFLWPDRRNNNLYFSTTNQVHAIRDDGSSFSNLWTQGSFSNPSMVLQKPGTDFIYFGDGNGRLIQIDVVSQVQTPLSLESAGAIIGAPSYDSTHGLVIVGSSTGTVHAVRVPY